MAAAIESLPFFRARALQIGITEAAVDTLQAANLGSYGAFAFLAPYNANSTDLKQLAQSLEDVLGAAPDNVTMPLWRRLQFDAHTHVLADARARIERTESTEPRRIPMPEKSARLEEQRRRLTHLQITSDLEPSHSLIDEISQMMEDGVLKHISVDKCTSRRQEMAHIKKEPSVKIDSSGGIKLVQVSISPNADTSSHLCLRTAFQRRSLAFDQCRLVTYVEHERWINHLFAQLNHIPPPGYAVVSIEQLLQADIEMFTMLANDCRQGLAVDGAGVMPVEAALIKNMFAPQITYAILPLPTSKGNPKKRLISDDDDRTGKRSRKDKGQGKGNQVASGKGSKSSAKGISKAQAKTKAAETFATMPDLKGMWSSVRGNPLCARYQLGTCPEEAFVAKGDRCSKGMHACCVPKCFENHSMKDHI